LRPFSAILVAFAMLAFAVPNLRAEPVAFVASDGVKIFGQAQIGADKSKPLVLLFHQSGSNAGEYAAIAPHLAAQGYSTLAIDQRSGGSAYGRRNETVAQLGRSTGYLEALADLSAAVDWAQAQGFKGKIVAWGSSYSASLVFVLAARDPRVGAVIAFSPGEYFGDRNLVAKAAAGVRQPLLVSSASDASERAEAAALLARAPALDKLQLSPASAAHGSSALAGPAARELWSAIDRFLAKL
jgi:dienelactone hydrolase